MADIKGSHDKKGYLTIAANAHAGIAIRKNINEPDRRLMNQVWFDTGLKMADGTPRTVAASSEAEVVEYRKKKGYREIGIHQPVTAPVTVPAPQCGEPTPGDDAGTVDKEEPQAGTEAEHLAQPDPGKPGPGPAPAEAAADAAAPQQTELLDAGKPGPSSADAPKAGTRSSRGSNK